MTVQHEYSVSEDTKHCIIFTASLTFLFPGSQCDMYNSELLLKVSRQQFVTCGQYPSD